MRQRGRLDWRVGCGLAAMGLLALALGVPGTASAAPGGTISGTVTAAAAGHAPLESVLVCAWTLDEEDEKCGSTAADGTYTITDLPPGSYKVDFSEFSAGYVGQYYDAKSSWVDANPVTVMDGATTSNIDAELVLGGTITGTVIDAVTKVGLAGFRFVCASSGTHEECEETDSNGQYTLTALPEGDYIVSFEFFDDSDYVNQYYNGQPSWELGNPVHVTAGSTASNINAELHKGGRIAGTVTRALDGTSLSDIEVCAHEDRPPNYWALRCAYTNASGQYTIHGLATGHYKVEFSPDWPGEPNDEFPPQFFNDRATLAEAEWVDVTAPGTTTGIDGHLGVMPMQPAITPPTITPPTITPPTITPPTITPPLALPVAPKPRPKPLTVKLTAPKQSLGTISKTGVIRTSCRLSAAGRCAVVATISAKDAKALGLKVKKDAKAMTIGSGHAVLGKSGTVIVRVKLSPKVKAALAEAKALKVKLVVTAGGGQKSLSLRLRG